MANGNFSKARNVTFLVYLKDWEKTYGELLEYLDGLHMPCACSPVHDKDTYTSLDVQRWVDRNTDKETGKVSEEAIKAGLPTVGQNKKEHVHVLLSAPGPVTPEWFLEKMEGFYSIPYFESVNSVPSLLRYFAHLDSPEKHQYNAMEIHGFGGIDLSPLLKSDKVSNIMVLLDIMDYMMKHHIDNYHSLVHWSLTTGDIDTFSIVTGRAGFFSSYFNSIRNEKNDRKKLESDLEQ